jgi:hypothetical protein
MNFSNLHRKGCILGLALTATIFSSCEKDGNPNNLPDVNASDYVGKIDGFSTTDEIYPNNLVAYWDFETKSEKKTNTAPTSTANDAIVDGGFKGKGLSLTNGYLYYANQFPAFKTDVFKSFTISTWVQISNNGATKTMLFQLARPGIFNGNINFVLETNLKPASDILNLSVHPTFTAVSGGTQDNVNQSFGKSPKIGPNTWVHLALTYDGSSGTFNIFANGVNIGNYSGRGVGTALFNSYEPNEVIIGGNYNVIPGKAIGTDATFAAMTGKIDEVRIYNRSIPESIIKSMYNLGLAGK